MNQLEALQAAAMMLQKSAGAGGPGRQMGAGGAGAMMPGPRIEEDQPGWNPATMGNKLGMVQPPTGGMMPNNLDAIMRRMGGGGPPQLPGAVPGEHQGLSELGQQSGLEEIMALLANSKRMQSPTSMIPGVGPGIGIEEDMPQWDWKTMGNQRRGVTDPLSGKKRIETSNAPRVGRAGRGK